MRTIDFHARYVQERRLDVVSRALQVLFGRPVDGGRSEVFEPGPETVVHLGVITPDGFVVAHSWRWCDFSVSKAADELWSAAQFRGANRVGIGCGELPPLNGGVVARDPDFLVGVE